MHELETSEKVHGGHCISSIRYGIYRYMTTKLVFGSF
jgi:hypothetical protein